MKEEFRVALKGSIRNVLLKVEGRVRLLISEVGRRRGENAGAAGLGGSADREALELKRVRARERVRIL